mmetsp:Transcript_9828/g.21014  ORF Transcript_9828/g.21014 Transcript_9828/m.21014 type:complete len:89 (-) Transcript_9828:275-541(-)
MLMWPVLWQGRAGGGMLRGRCWPPGGIASVVVSLSAARGCLHIVPCDGQIQGGRDLHAFCNSQAAAAAVESQMISFLESASSHGYSGT